MKKSVLIILIIGIVITTFSGCSNKIVGKEFSSEEEMISYLEGTWVERSSVGFHVWTFKGNGDAGGFSDLPIDNKVYFSESGNNEYNYKNGTFHRYNRPAPDIVIKESGVFAIKNNDPEKISELYKLSDSASLGQKIADTYNKLLEKREDCRLFKESYFEYGGADDYGVSFVVEYHEDFITRTDVTLIAARTEDCRAFYNQIKDKKEGSDLGPNLLVIAGKNTAEKIGDKSIYELVYYLYVTNNGEILTNIN